MEERDREVLFCSLQHSEIPDGKKEEEEEEKKKKKEDQ